ncbi:phosphoglycolate phosphatase [Massilia terrae]|uniref:Phosphoglycolate phosphatase n=1 Tax=Massilia terrae TaxID=1811224 RepID=A0ABT2D5N0_9BURK|nr:phosphoglycolate phosphatase [Massilia terrae]MCS0661071.1 phosphoglycolate phosphatase [Massilia terrae]
MRSGAAAIRAAIIDLDGTMLDTVPDFELALNGMRAELGLAPIGQETITPMVGKGSEKLIRDVLSLDLPQAQVEAQYETAMAAYQRHYLAINGQRATMYEGVTEGLCKLRSLGLRLACVTNKPVAFAQPLLAQKGLTPYFDLMYGGDSLPKKKPDPLPLLQVCSDFDLPPSQVVAIGDSSNDAQAARAAGCFVLTVPYGYNHGRPVHEINSDGIVGTLFDAANLIEAHNSNTN